MVNIETSFFSYKNAITETTNIFLHSPGMLTVLIMIDKESEVVPAFYSVRWFSLSKLDVC